MIVGGGIIGVCSAYFLARKGCRVTLIEKATLGDPVAASFGNAGLISIGHPPLPRPGTVVRALKWMFNPTSPLLLVPRADFGLLRWLIGFARAGSHANLEHSMRVIAELSAPTIELFNHFAHEGVDFEYRTGGYMDVFRTDPGFAHAKVEQDFLHRFGFRDEAIPGDEARKREPALLPNVTGALWHPDSAFVSPNKFMSSIGSLLSRVGVEIREHTAMDDVIVRQGRVVGVRTNTGEELTADAVVLAAGAWTTPLARRAGVRVPMEPAKGYHVEVEYTDAAAPRLKIACSCGEAYVAVTPMNSGVRLAGTLELSGLNHELRRERVDILPVQAALYIAGLGTAKVRSSWCGLRPCTADGLPAIGWAPKLPGLFIATGHAMMGFWTGPISGKLVSELMLSESPSINPHPMRVERL